MESAQTLHSEFHAVRDKFLSKLADIIFSNLHSQIPCKVILCLSRKRTYIRLKDINKKTVSKIVYGN